MKPVASEWGTAEVAVVLTASDFSDTHTFATFVLKPNTELIFSLDPAEDYEVNPHTIDGWRMIFIDENGETLGDTDYMKTLDCLTNFAIDQNNNSILIKKLTQAELKQVFYAANGERTIQLTL